MSFGMHLRQVVCTLGIAVVPRFINNLWSGQAVGDQATNPLHMAGLT
jgi:hypothetical protein